MLGITFKRICEFNKITSFEMIKRVKTKNCRVLCPFCQKENVKNVDDEDDTCEHFRGVQVKEIQYDFYFMGTLSKAG